MPRRLLDGLLLTATVAVSERIVSRIRAVTLAGPHLAGLTNFSDYADCDGEPA